MTAAESLGLRFDPLDNSQAEVRWEFWDEARRTAPVFHNPKYDVWFVTRYEDCDRVQRDHKHFSTSSVFAPARPWPPTVQAILDEGHSWKYFLSNNDPPEHTPLKRAVAKAFSRSETREAEERVRGIASRLIDGIVDQGEAELAEAIAYPFPALVVMEILGFPREDVEQLKAWGDAWLTLFSDTDDVAVLEQAARDFIAFQNYMLDHFRARQENPTDDLMSHLVQQLAAEKTGLTIEDIVNVPINLMTAGHATGTLLMLEEVTELLKDPELMADVRANPEKIPKLVEEALRYEPPVHGIFRTTLSEVEVAGVTIPEGARVLICYGSANHDPAKFKCPAHFDIDRDDVDAHLGFGKGTHFCPGAWFARMEQRVVLELLLERCPNLRFHPDHEQERLEHFWLRGYQKLWVQWDTPDATTSGEAPVATAA